MIFVVLLRQTHADELEQQGYVSLSDRLIEVQLDHQQCKGDFDGTRSEFILKLGGEH
jgi:hypothetical protein